MSYTVLKLWQHKVLSSAATLMTIHKSAEGICQLLYSILVLA
jgi:hypothetical protein